MEFQYRGQRRWTGVWDNPNTYGVLMGVGAVLAAGLLVASYRLQVAGLHSPRSRVWRISRFHKLNVLALFAASGLCGFGLLKSYSRGAWLGTAVGIGFLLWKWINREPREIHEKLTQEKPSTFNFQPATHRIWLPSSILIVSMLVISFWQFRHTESPLLRRVFSVGNVNDFSWRNRVTAWQGAGRMMWDKPIIGFGWGKAEEIYSKEYRAARLEESAAVQLNDYLMIGISAGVPALVCLLVYLYLVVGRGAGKLSTFNLQLSTAAKAGVAVLLIGFWFDGGLFKLPTCGVFWVLLELCRSRGSLAIYRSDDTHANEGRARHSVRAVGDNETDARHLTQSPHPQPLSHPLGEGGVGLSPVEAESGCGAQRTARPTIVLRWLVGLFALLAIGLTTLHLGTRQLAVSERTLNIARKFIVPPNEKANFEYLAAKNIWSNTPLKTLLQHAHLANYNRTLVNWKLDDDLYREFVLSPEILVAADVSLLKQNAEEIRADSRRLLRDGGRVSAPSTLPTMNHPLSTDLNWRRPLWEYFYPRIRKESSLEAAAEIVVRHLRERVTISEGENLPVDVQSIWQRQITSVAGFERIYVAALRSAGIPARLTATGQAEFWNGAEWKSAPRPVEAKGTTVEK